MPLPSRRSRRTPCRATARASARLPVCMKAPCAGMDRRWPGRPRREPAAVAPLDRAGRARQDGDGALWRGRCGLASRNRDRSSVRAGEGDPPGPGAQGRWNGAAPRGRAGGGARTTPPPNCAGPSFPAPRRAPPSCRLDDWCGSKAWFQPRPAPTLGAAYRPRTPARGTDEGNAREPASIGAAEARERRRPEAERWGLFPGAGGRRGNSRPDVPMSAYGPERPSARGAPETGAPPEMCRKPPKRACRRPWAGAGALWGALSGIRWGRLPGSAAGRALPSFGGGPNAGGGRGRDRMAESVPQRRPRRVRASATARPSPPQTCLGRAGRATAGSASLAAGFAVVGRRAIRRIRHSLNALSPRLAAGNKRPGPAA